MVSLPPLISPTPGSQNLSPAKATPSSLPEREKQNLQHFKQFLVQLYNNAGVKGEKIVFLLHDDKYLLPSVFFDASRHSHTMGLDGETDFVLATKNVKNRAKT